MGRIKGYFRRAEGSGVLTAVFIPLFIGGLSALISVGAMKDYSALAKPPLSPPAWLFPVVWTLLYVLMGIASYLVLKSGKGGELVRESLVLYGLQLLFNFFWSIIFFNLEMYALAFVWLLALLGLVIVSGISFFKINKTAGLLLVPYIIWVTFAGYLNLMTVILN